MNPTAKTVLAFLAMAALLVAVGFGQSWSLMFTILNLCLISSVMALGVNIQWGYAGLFNVGIMGFAALGGVAAVLVSKSPVPGTWAAGGPGLLATIAVCAATVAGIVLLRRRLPVGRMRTIGIAILVITGFIAARYFYIPAVTAIEAVNPAKHGYLGGLGMPIILSWIAGGLLAAGAAWIVGKIALGLRSDYLAIATLGISEIIIALMKNEDWLTRGVKNVTGLPRPVPYEIDLQKSEWFINLVASLNDSTLSALDVTARPEALQQLVIDYSSIYVKLCYTGLFALVLAVLLVLSISALNSPWGRMMRAIRENEVAASAMGKDITVRHRQVFILGSAVVGIAGAMLTTLDGQFTPGTYNPLRFTFLIWVMVIVGGSGNNLGAVLGGFLVWFIWIEAEPLGLWLVNGATFWLGSENAFRLHLLGNAQHMRPLLMGVLLLLVLRFRPAGILPEVVRHQGK